MLPVKRIHSTWYLLGDYLAATMAWIVLYFTRRYLLHESLYFEHEIYLNNRFWFGITLVPLTWLFLYALTGAYIIDIAANISIAAPHRAVIPAHAGIQYAAAFRFDHWRLWDTGSPVKPGDDS